MTGLLEVYRCDICGNIVEVIHTGGGDLYCCGEPMKRLSETANEGAAEKHIPAVERLANCTLVKVGVVPHPMEEDHYIEWIEVEIDGKAYRKFLKPGDAPEAAFEVVGEGIKAREYCTLHGLWKGSGPC
ncbi:MAG: desulfoferrodoxin [Armatimonadetes bacterium]|nr:desulfoferrodoxin [Armatimonadota bacterium]